MPRFSAREFARFLATGVLNTAFGFAVYSGLVLAGLDEGWALLAATALGVFFNFFSFARLTFRVRHAGRLPRFLLAYSAIYLFNLALLKALRAAAGLGPLEAQLACLVIVAPGSYLLLKRVVFRAASHE